MGCRHGSIARSGVVDCLRATNTAVISKQPLVVCVQSACVSHPAYPSHPRYCTQRNNRGAYMSCTVHDPIPWFSAGVHLHIFNFRNKQNTIPHNYLQTAQRLSKSLRHHLRPVAVKCQLVATACCTRHCKHNIVQSPRLASPCMCICIAAVRSSQSDIVCPDHHLNRYRFNSACPTVQNGPCHATGYGAVSVLPSVLDLRIHPARDVCRTDMSIPLWPAGSHTKSSTITACASAFNLTAAAQHT
jgi:hypothetical protein